MSALAILDWAITIAQILLGLAMCCATFRLVTGPRAQDLSDDSLSPRLLRAVAAAHRRPGIGTSRGERRAVVGMLTGCVQSAFFPDVNAATIRILAGGAPK